MNLFLFAECDWQYVNIIPFHSFDSFIVNFTWYNLTTIFLSSIILYLGTIPILVDGPSNIRFVVLEWKVLAAQKYNMGWSKEHQWYKVCSSLRFMGSFSIFYCFVYASVCRWKVSYALQYIIFSHDYLLFCQCTFVFFLLPMILLMLIFLLFLGMSRTLGPVREMPDYPVQGFVIIIICIVFFKVFFSFAQYFQFIHKNKKRERERSILAPSNIMM